MEKKSFILKELSIHKMPGLPRGLPDYKEFATNINIIYGANGSGKSSSARAIRQLLWRYQPGGIQAEMSALIEHDHWDIKLDSTKTVVQRNGINESLTGLPTVEESERYLLAMHELINNDDQGLAQLIIKESIGGYDLEAAGKELGYTAGARPRNTTEYKTFSTADSDFDRLKKEHESLKREEDELNPLRQEKGQGEKARELKSWYEKLFSFLETDIKLIQASSAVAGFPDLLEHMTGEEYDNIEDLERQIETIGKTIQNTEDKIDEQQGLIEVLNLPSGGLSMTVINEIEERINSVENAERELGQCNKELEAANVSEQQAVEKIGEGRNMEQWQGLSAADVSRLDEFLQKIHLTLSEKQAIESLIETLMKEAPEGPGPSPDHLQAGIQALSYWLQEYQDSGLLSRRWLWILAFLGIGTAVFAYSFGSIGFLGVPVILACVFFARNKRHAPQASRQNEYNTTGLEQPLSWNREEVIKKLDELIGQLRQSGWQERIRIKIEVYENQLESLQPRLQQLELEHKLLEEQLKSMPESPGEDLKSFDALFWFLKHVGQWQESHTNVLLLKARKDQIEQDITINRERINELLAQSNAEQVIDAASAKAVFKQMKQLDKTWHETSAEIEHGRAILRDSQQQKSKLETKMKAIYAKLNIEDEQKEQVRRLVLQLDAYKQAKEDKQAQGLVFSEKQLELKRHSLYDQLIPEIEHLNQGMVTEKIRELSVKVDGLEQINNKITEIETKIGLKKAGSTLEEAFFKREEAMDSLLDMFESNLSAITGKILINRLKKSAGDENRPPVFRKAKEIFSRITNGRYELLVHDGDTPSFKAYDTVLKMGQELSELSTGTRTQLLLAVRLGFIEILETYYRLPVLADELLANSDDNRSKAIIEALTEISRQGRQVFYFTAQKEEVSKWRDFLDNNPGISYKIFELDGSSNEASNISNNESDFPVFQFVSEVPDPINNSHAEYGKILKIDNFNLVTEAPEALHLWYLVNDTSVLADLLKRGISKWGQLQSFIEYNGQLPGCDQKLIDQITAKTAFLQRYIDLYRQGRATPIDRAILEQSQAVSARFIDAIADKLNELNGNPQKLVQALKNREVNRFSSASIDQLEQFLIEEGYIDNQDIISHEDILLRMSAFLTNTTLNPHEVEQFINRVLNTVNSKAEYVLDRPDLN
jgi:uncharacterized protein YhaN